MEHSLLKKLGHGADLDPEDKATLLRGLGRVRRYPADCDIIADRDRPRSVRLIVEGMACRSKALSGGELTITAFLLPGDLCDLDVAILGRMDHTICALAPSEVVDIAQSTIEEWTERHPRINRALWWANLVDEATLRAWLTNLGARRASERIAHLFCELRLRLETVGLATEDGFLLPLTQAQLGQAVGLSVVHVNRVLVGLRTAGLVTFRAGRVEIPDLQRLSLMAGFDPGYLHLTGSSGRSGTTRA